MADSSQDEPPSKKENTKGRFQSISRDLRRYIEKQTELVTLEIVDRVSGMIARSIHKITGLFFLIFAYIFLMIALAKYVGPLLGHPSYGYLLVGVLTGFIGLLFAAVKPAGLSRRMKRKWVNQIFKEAVAPKPHNRRKGEKANSEGGRTEADPDSNRTNTE